MNENSAVFHEAPKQTSYWDTVLNPEGMHVEPQLLTPEGRFHAFLNLANATTKTFIVFSLSENFQATSEVSLRRNKALGIKIRSDTNSKHLLEGSISHVGAAAKSETNNDYWARTPFGTAAIPALVYFAKVVEEIDLNPLKAIGSQSSLKIGEEGELITTPAVERATALRAAALGEATQIKDLRPKMNIAKHGIATHLKPLREAGLVDFDSSDPVNSRTYYSVSPFGNATKDWGSFAKYSKDGKEFKYTKGSKIVADALVCMAVLGITEASREDVRDFVSSQWDLKIDISDMSSIMKFFSEQGFLERSEFNEEKASDIQITEKGAQFNEAMEEISNYFVDPYLAPHIDAIRRSLGISLDGRHPMQMWQSIETQFPGLLQAMQERYSRVRRDLVSRDEKAQILIEEIRKNNGQFSFSEIAKRAQLNQVTVRGTLKKYLKSGEVIATMRLRENGKQFGKKQYLSIPED